MIEEFILTRSTTPTNIRIRFLRSISLVIIVVDLKSTISYSFL
jgi:hypothetical protein